MTQSGSDIGLMGRMNVVGIPSVLGTVSNAIAITSGKGGVGRSSLVANVGLALGKFGKRILILDCDLGLPGIHGQFGIVPSYDLQDVLEGRIGIRDALVAAPLGVTILPAPFGNQDLAVLSREQKLNTVSLLEELSPDYDLILLDTGAGISANVEFFSLLARRVILVVTPDTTAIAGAHALLKVLARSNSRDRFWVVVNQTHGDGEGMESFKMLWSAIQDLDSISLDYLGSVPFDSRFRLVSGRERPFMSANPHCPAARQLLGLSQEIAALIPETGRGGRPVIDTSGWYSSVER